ncbi:methyltransferase domain-containing protein [Actinoplanes sp. TBRC 11911]|uniref:class I SAM-dependent methyltransferase n=1 Tax=Actinoplanes sp. TBRC 11911 TaxID=2729386 RepID=UPI00145D9436|nr:class I SAM-dependent methyltransferase [Actinoplanes sp. TBRC 11911]NMO50426.1 methyltransferase domain-containing protein [Actinoplanes sp. TBRC 11911]
MNDFDALLAEAEAVPLEGWDFSWFAGRATEERPSWGYADRVADRLTRATAALDVQTGGGEVMAYALGTARPSMLVAVEAWPPNVGVAARTLAPFGGRVIHSDRIPFRDGTFDLVTSRHPVDTPWPEIARVLRPGGVFLSQQIGAGTNRELAEAMMGPLPAPERQHPGEAAEAAGLEVLEVRSESLRAEFYDVGAVAHFLRKVVWTVPGFEIGKYRDRLRAVHHEINDKGKFVSYARRVLIEARRNAR